MNKIKNFFIWLAWLGERGSERNMLIIYSIMLALLVVIFFPLWLMSENIPKSVAIAFGSSIGLVMLANFIASVFFSSSEKNWRMAIKEAERVIYAYPEIVIEEDRYAAAYIKGLNSIILDLSTGKNQDPTRLNEFAKPYKELFRARKESLDMISQQDRIVKEIHKAREEINRRGF